MGDFASKPAAVGPSEPEYLRLSTDERIRVLLHSLLTHRPERIYLFGSAACGEADELSDLDVVIILDSPLPFLERLAHLARYIPGESGAVDLLAYTPAEWEQMLSAGNAFAEMVAEEGKLLYDRASQG